MWLTGLSGCQANQRQVLWNLLTEASGARFVKKINSWKAPGCDGIYGFWCKQFQQATELLGQAVWGMLGGDSEDIPA